MQTTQRTVKGVKPKTHLSFQIDFELMEKIDQHIGVFGNRSGFVRQLIEDGIEQIEKQAKQQAEKNE